MSYLLYCMFKSDGVKFTRELTGPAGEPVFVVGCEGLSAALSRAIASEERPRMGVLLAYANVIESFNRQRAVVPMRYGQWFDATSEVRAILGRHAARYRALLEWLDGCVEMTVHALLSCLAEVPDSPLNLPAAGVERFAPGKAYLAAREREFAAQDTFASGCEHIVRELKAAFAGLFKHCVSPRGQLARAPTLPTHFLVPAKSLGRFRHAFEGVRATSEVPLLMTGPWPAYNFVGETMPAGADVMNLVTARL